MSSDLTHPLTWRIDASKAAGKGGVVSMDDYEAAGGYTGARRDRRGTQTWWPDGGSADAAFSSASGKGVTAVCLSGAGNTWQLALVRSVSARRAVVAVAPAVTVGMLIVVVSATTDGVAVAPAVTVGVLITVEKSTAIFTVARSGVMSIRLPPV